jgi:hypothetical protein
MDEVKKLVKVGLPVDQAGPVIASLLTTMSVDEKALKLIIR